MIKNISRKTKDLVFVLPSLLIIVIFTYCPIIKLIELSFSDWNLLSDTYSYIGFDNYKWLFDGIGSKYLWNSLKITLIYSFFEILVTILGGLFLSLLLNEASKKYKVFRTIVLIPRYISVTCSALIFLWILNTDNGILNQIINLFGLDNVDWLGEKTTAFFSIILVSAWRNIGYGMMMCNSAISNIPCEYYEAAKIDSIPRHKIFLKITLPQIIPTLEFLAMTSFLSSVKNFQTIDIMTSGGPMRSTEMIVYLIYRYALIDFRMGKAATIAIILFTILMIITIACLIIARKIKKIYS